MEVIEERITKGDPDFKDINPPKTRERSKSLFQAERPKLTETDRGVFVMTHADFPRRIRTQSMPIDPEKLKPKSSAFNSSTIRKIIHDVLEDKLSGKNYSPKECSSAVRDIVNIIKVKMSELQMPHYKFACTCLITKRIKPAPAVESGCVWDNAKTSVDQDNFAEFLYKNEDLYALGTVYGIYDEKFEKRSSATTSMSTKSYGRPSPIPE
ncbi:tctex1 domain-containing protein 1-like [Actinia tenebrosa]|uniref:Tctex1 domain-containing protein 1-like n=1 Tax=Actinia tenebrosa TaxID=6105 RepID=A0A6P8ICS2_ACTTE|nr:tctex1 domain-containing protein 1-like [Actinia tenebrosa]